jgi:hypothetical protein
LLLLGKDALFLAQKSMLINVHARVEPQYSEKAPRRRYAAPESNAFALMLYSLFKVNL